MLIGLESLRVLTRNKLRAHLSYGPSSAEAAITRRCSQLTVQGNK